MTIKASGTPLAITEVESEFGGAAPTSFSEYYRGGTYVTNQPPWNSAIPNTTGSAIDLGVFYGKDKYYSGSISYTSSGSYDYKLPAYADSITITLHAGGGGGGTAAYGEWANVAGGGGGGGAGQYKSETFTGQGGKSLAIYVGAGGGGGYWWQEDGKNGSVSYVNSNGTRLITADYGRGGKKAPAYTGDNKDYQVAGGAGGAGYPAGASAPNGYWGAQIQGGIIGYDNYGNPIYSYTYWGDRNGANGATPSSKQGTGGAGGSTWGGNATGYGAGGGGGGFTPGWRNSGHFSGIGAGWWGGGAGTGGYVTVSW